MNRCSQFAMFLIVIMVFGTFSGIYASNNNSNPSNINIKMNNGIFKIFYVAKNGTDRNDGLTPGKAKRNIQNAIDSASTGDTVVVGPGTYVEVPLRIYQNITIHGSGQDKTIINAQGQPYRCISINPDVTATITDITLKNASSKDKRWLSVGCGGGIQNNGILTLKKVTITDNMIGHGAGIDNMGIMILNEVNVQNNSANGFGGGIYNGNRMTINNSKITGNKAPFGGGIYNLGNMVISNTTISQNSASDDGGGICTHRPLTIEDSIVTKNSAFCNGGGIYATDVYIFGCVISNNRAGAGGGLFIHYRAYIDNPTIIMNNTWNNIAGAQILPA